jgi:hypothetical protein
VEADWEFEVGGGAPVIEACWPGFVDLRADPGRVTELPEVRQLPTLAQPLVRLNAPDSPVWSSKVDIFLPESIDPYELDASPEEAICAIACYVDLHGQNAQHWKSPFAVEQFCKESCRRLSSMILRCCRVDLVIRRAHYPAEHPVFAVTVYLTACGPSVADAQTRLGACLSAFVAAVLAAPE